MNLKSKIPAIMTIVGFIILCILGTWQVKRLVWKNNLIESMNEKVTMAPIDIEQAINNFEENKYRKVKLVGEFIHDEEIHLFVGKRTARSREGYSILTPFITENGKTILVDRGWIDSDRKDKNTRPETLIEGVVELTGMLHSGEKQGKWTPENNIEGNLWFWIDMNKIVELTSVENKDFYVRLLKQNNDNTYPIKGEVVIKKRNDHLQYAVTWFSLAIILLVIYFIYQKSEKKSSPHNG